MESLGAEHVHDPVSCVILRGCRWRHWLSWLVRWLRLGVIDVTQLHLLMRWQYFVAGCLLWWRMQVRSFNLAYLAQVDLTLVGGRPRTRSGLVPTAGLAVGFVRLDSDKFVTLRRIVQFWGPEIGPRCVGLRIQQFSLPLLGWGALLSSWVNRFTDLPQITTIFAIDFGNFFIVTYCLMHHPMGVRARVGAIRIGVGPGLLGDALALGWAQRRRHVIIPWWWVAHAWSSALWRFFYRI